MKFCLKMMVLVVLSFFAFGCAKQPSSHVGKVARGPNVCTTVRVFDPNTGAWVNEDSCKVGGQECHKTSVFDPRTNTFKEEDVCNTDFGWRATAMMRGATNPIVLATPAEAALMTATHNPAAKRCQKFVVEMSDGTTREDEECVPADARVITSMPARQPVNLGTSTTRR